jgi:hypothetical protein
VRDAGWGQRRGHPGPCSGASHVFFFCIVPFFCPYPCLVGLEQPLQAASWAGGIAGPSDARWSPTARMS